MSWVVGSKSWVVGKVVGKVVCKVVGTRNIKIKKKTLIIIIIIIIIIIKQSNLAKSRKCLLFSFNNKMIRGLKNVVRNSGILK
jgi:hypothetical protein